MNIPRLTAVGVATLALAMGALAASVAVAAPAHVDNPGVAVASPAHVDNPGV